MNPGHRLGPGVGPIIQHNIARYVAARRGAHDSAEAPGAA
jgi:hypothetical protein